jgi:hypothetical protein
VEEYTPGGLGSAESAYATELGIEAPKSGVGVNFPQSSSASRFTARCDAPVGRIVSGISAPAGALPL